MGSAGIRLGTVVRLAAATGRAGASPAPTMATRTAAASAAVKRPLISSPPWTLTYSSRSG